MSDPLDGPSVYFRLRGRPADRAYRTARVAGQKINKDVNFLEETDQSRTAY